jgi:hypothetical protein
MGRLHPALRALLVEWFQSVSERNRDHRLSGYHWSADRIDVGALGTQRRMERRIKGIDQRESPWILVGNLDGSNRRGNFRCRHRNSCEVGTLRLNSEHYHLSVYQRSLVRSYGLRMAVPRISAGTDIRRAYGLHPLLRLR